MIEWITFSGTSGYQWLPFAKKQARFMMEFGTRPTKFLRMNDGTEIYIRVDGDEAHIRISGVKGGGGYQFIGSLARLYKTFDDDTFPAGTRYLPLVYATSVTYKNGKWTATPLVSSAEAPAPGVAPTWPYDPDPRNTDQYLKISPAHQPDGLGIKWHFSTTPESPTRSIPWLVTQWQQPLPLSGLGRYGGANAAYHIANDMGYDLGPTLFEGAGLSGANKTPDSDWYGQAAIHTVAGRQFIIMVDINSVFYCYPTTGYDDTIIPGGGEWAGEKANVPLDLTQNQACPFPSWVTNELLGVAAIQAGVSNDDHLGRLRTMWAFNQTGTRAACVVAHRAAPWSDAYFTSSRYRSNGTLDNLCREDYPGMVEVEFTVEVTGEGLDDFTFSVSLRQDIYSKTDFRCPVAVGYAMKDMGTVPRDALIMLDYQYYTDNPSMTAPPYHEGSLYRLLRPNNATVASVQWQSEEGDWTEYRRWLAYYFCLPGDGFGYTVPGPAARKFSPTMDEFPGTPEEGYRYSYFSYIGRIISLDLSSLSWCVAADASQRGEFFYEKIEGGFGTYVSEHYGAEAVAVILTVFGAERNRLSLGHELMKPAASAMHDLTHLYPNIGNMTRIHLNATAGYAVYGSDVKDNAVLIVNDGDGNSWSHAVEDAHEEISRYYSVQNNTTLFPDMAEAWAPGIYSFYDSNGAIVRPGYRWWKESGLQPGETAFTGYPYGALQHARVYFLTMTSMGAIYQQVKTHINGSWSATLGPFAALTGLQSLLVDVPDTYEHGFIDRIVLVDKNGNENGTSHVAMLNKAFSKELSPADYYFTVRKIGEGTGPEIQPASNDTSPQGWFHVNVPGAVGVGWYGEYAGSWDTPLAHLRSRANITYILGDSFMSTYPYPTYGPFLTFPNPRMECVFHPTGTE